MVQVIDDEVSVDDDLVEKICEFKDHSHKPIADVGTVGQPELTIEARGERLA
jgi:hypothetical protein